MRPLPQPKIHLLAALALVWVLAGSAHAVETHTARAKGSVGYSTDYGYVEFLPTAYFTSTAKLPVLLYLHDSTQVGPGTDPVALMTTMTTTKGPSTLIAGGSTRFNTENCIVISPQTSSAWDANDLRRFLSFVQTKYATRIDLNRMYITGIGMGATAALKYCSNNILFVACLPIDPDSGPNVPSTSPDGSGLSNVATWAFAGMAGTNYSVEWCDKVARLLYQQPSAPPDPLASRPITIPIPTMTGEFLNPKAASPWDWRDGIFTSVGPHPKLTIYPGVANAWTPTFAEDRVWTWLFVQRKGLKPLNTSPTISKIGPQFVSEDGTLTIPITIGDLESSYVFFTYVSSDPSIIADVTVSGSGAARNVIVRPVANQFTALGSPVTITLTIKDDGKKSSLATASGVSPMLSVSEPFDVNVYAVNDAPTITTIANQKTLPGVAKGPLSFTVGDPDTPLTSLVVTATSSNPTLIPPAGISITGAGTAAQTITLTPSGILEGSAIITLSVSDGSLFTYTTFKITVSSDVIAPAAPTITVVNPGTYTPSFSGTTEPNITIEIYSNGVLVATTTANSSGNWAWVPSGGIGGGNHAIYAVAVDAGANSSPPSATININRPANAYDGTASAGNCLGGTVGMLLFGFGLVLIPRRRGKR